MVGMYTVCAYGGIAMICSGYWYLSKRRPRRQSKASQQKELRDGRAKAALKEKENKSRKLKSTGESSGNEAQKRKTKREAEKAEPFVTYVDNSPEDHPDDREFARQLSHAKTGTTMAPKNEAGSRQKSVKLSKAKTSDDDEVLSRINGEHVSDGDDDLSSAASPELSATVLRSGDVSDMLENTKAGPSVLRLTESTKQQPVKPKKALKQKEPEPTKKQRQNQAKREAERLLNEETEKERRIQAERQRRTAREAEGRAAKDGTSTIYSQPPPKISAWSTADRDNASTNHEPVQLLDTYVPGVPPTGTADHESQEPRRQGARPAEGPARQTAAPSMAHYSNLPSEEEQVRLLSENDDSGWAEVKPKKSRGKLVKAGSENLSPALSDSTINVNKFAGFESEA